MKPTQPSRIQLAFIVIGACGGFGGAAWLAVQAGSVAVLAVVPIGVALGLALGIVILPAQRKWVARKRAGLTPEPLPWWYWILFGGGPPALTFVLKGTDSPWRYGAFSLACVILGTGAVVAFFLAFRPPSRFEQRGERERMSWHGSGVDRGTRYSWHRRGSRRGEPRDRR